MALVARKVKVGGIMRWVKQLSLFFISHSLTSEDSASQFIISISNP